MGQEAHFYYDEFDLEEDSKSTSNSKKYAYTYEDYEEGGKNAAMLVNEILADPEFPQIRELIIGSWGEAWDEGGQAIVDGIVANKEKFSHIESLFIGDMEGEECEVSWIVQADYSKLWEAMPQLKSLTIKGASELSLGKVSHEALESLTIICGGLGSDVIEQITEAKLPSLKHLELLFGVENYGFDGDINTIKDLLNKSDFPQLEELGLCDSELENEIVKAFFESRYKDQVKSVCFSMGGLTDEGGEVLCRKLPDCEKLMYLEIVYHYMSENMEKKIEKVCAENNITVKIDDREEADDWDGEMYYYPMVTE